MQPMYALVINDPALGGPKRRLAPLELKVQVLFGVAVGGTLNTHSGELWVTRAGGIHIWDEEDLKERGHTRCRKVDRCYGKQLPLGARDTLRQVLRDDWCWMRAASERLCREARLDELRVDW